MNISILAQLFQWFEFFHNLCYVVELYQMNEEKIEKIVGDDDDSD